MTEKPKDFYAQKGMLRYTLILTEGHKNRLKTVADTYGLSQGDVVEVLIDQMNLELLQKHLTAKRNAKIDGRRVTEGVSKTSLIKQMKDLPADKLAAIAAIINQPK